SLPVFASALSFVLYVALGGELEPKIIFPALAYFTVLRVPLMVLPACYTAAADAYVAMKRIFYFLLSEETSPIPPPDPSHEYALSITNASFHWDQLSTASSSGNSGAETTAATTKPTPNANDSSDEATVTSETHPYLCNVNIRIPRGALVAV
ncbi:hypothetical protein BGZ94_006745, partial [Podila epigama]